MRAAPDAAMRRGLFLVAGCLALFAAHADAAIPSGHAACPQLDDYPLCTEWNSLPRCTYEPSAAPTLAPVPTKQPTPPTGVPTETPTIAPTQGAPLRPDLALPHRRRSAVATPTTQLTHSPHCAQPVPTTPTPTQAPTADPSTSPTQVPTEVPTEAPSAAPAAAPTSVAPTNNPTAVPSASPTKVPTHAPTAAPSTAPSSTTATTNGAPLCPELALSPLPLALHARSHTTCHSSPPPLNSLHSAPLRTTSSHNKDSDAGTDSKSECVSHAGAHKGSDERCVHHHELPRSLPHRRRIDYVSASTNT